MTTAHPHERRFHDCHEFPRCEVTLLPSKAPDRGSSREATTEAASAASRLRRAVARCRALGVRRVTSGSGPDRDVKRRGPWSATPRKEALKKVSGELTAHGRQIRPAARWNGSRFERRAHNHVARTFDERTPRMRWLAKKWRSSIRSPRIPANGRPASRMTEPYAVPRKCKVAPTPADHCDRAKMALIVSIVSASDAGLSSRYLFTRAKRRATPPGYWELACTPSKAISTTSSGRT